MFNLTSFSCWLNCSCIWWTNTIKFAKSLRASIKSSLLTLEELLHLCLLKDLVYSSTLADSSCLFFLPFCWLVCTVARELGCTLGFSTWGDTAATWCSSMLSSCSPCSSRRVYGCSSTWSSTSSILLPWSTSSAIYLFLLLNPPWTATPLLSLHVSISQ